MEWLQDLLNTREFMPHGHCFLWTPRLLWLFIVGETLTIVAYYAIPLALWYFARRRPDFPFRWVLWLFAAFIVLCGTTHILGLWNIWNSSYWLAGWITLITGLVSIITAIVLLPLIPRAIALPSPTQLKESYQLLQKQVAELEQTRAQLQLSERRFRQFVEVAQEGIWVLDNQGVTTFVNQSIADMLGFNKEEMIGQHLFQFMEEAEQAHASRNIERRLSGVAEKHTFWFRRKDGTQIYTIVSSAPLYDDAHNVTGMLGVITDITGQERTRAELAQLNTSLEMKVADRTQALSLSNDALRSEIMAREQAFADLDKSRQQLQAQSMAILRLNEMVETLQTVTNEHELLVVLRRYAQSMFSVEQVELMLVNDAQNSLQQLTVTGDANAPIKTFLRDDCWAFRKGRIHPASVEQDGILCQHLHDQLPNYRSFCVPMIARGEVLGVLVLQGERIITDSLFQTDFHRVLEAFGEQASLSLANLQLRLRLYEESIRDPLTGLFNRCYLHEQLTLETSRIGRGQSALSLLMVDVDLFKSINDRYGHDIGDQVLKQVAVQLRQAKRQGDVLSRYGGEEFVLLLPNSQRETAEERARAINATVAATPLQAGDITLNLTVSIGVATALTVVSGNQLLIAADAAMYAAKQAGRNCVEVAETLR